MANVDGAGGAEEWDQMNNKNRKLVKEWMKSSAMQVNTDRDRIGIEMVEVAE